MLAGTDDLQSPDGPQKVDWGQLTISWYTAFMSMRSARSLREDPQFRTLVDDLEALCCCTRVI
jgi:hypothetical protein